MSYISDNDSSREDVKNSLTANEVTEESQGKGSERSQYSSKEAGERLRRRLSGRKNRTSRGNII